MPLRPPCTVFHIVAAADWRRALARGVYAGSPVCRRDGFIHMSTAAQLAGTLARFFKGRDDMVLLAADAAALAPGLRWEEVPGAGTFPHYYGALDVMPLGVPSHDTPLGVPSHDARLVEVGPVRLGAGGVHVLPGALS